VSAYLIQAAGTFADAGPGPLIVPLGGSVILAGIFLSLAAITGGLWLVRRSQDPSTAGTSRKICFVSLGAAACCGAVLPAVLGFVYPAYWAAALLLLAAGVLLILAGFRSRSPEATRSTAPLEQAHFEPQTGPSALKGTEPIQENTRPSRG